MHSFLFLITITSISLLAGDADIQREILRKLNSPDRSLRTQGAQTLVLPAASEEPLRRMLGSEDWMEREAAAKALTRLSRVSLGTVNELLRLITDDESVVAVSAIDALGAAGAESKPALPALHNLLLKGSQNTQRAAVLHALARIDPAESLDVCHPFLNDSNATIRLLAARVFVAAGAKSLEYARVFAALLRDRAPDVRLAGAEGLLNSGSAAREYLDLLFSGLSDPSPQVAARCSDVLAGLGADSALRLVEASRINEPAVRLLVESALLRIAISKPDTLVAIASGNSPETTRAFALAPFKRISVPDDRLIAGLIMLGSSPVSEVRKEACDVLISFGPRAVSSLAKALENNDVKVAMHAAQALAAMGHSAYEALPFVIPMLRHQEPELRGAAAAIMSSIGPRASPFEENLARVMDDPQPTVRIAAIRALDGIGVRRKETVEALKRCLVEKDERLRTVSIKALSKSVEKTGNSEALAAILLKASEDVNADVRAAAAEGIGGLGEKASPLWPRLLKLANGDLPIVRAAALRAIVNVKGDERLTVSALENGLIDNSTRIRQAAAAGMADMGIRALSGLKTLSKALDDRDGNVRRDAFSAVVKMGPDGINALVELLDSAKVETRALAAQTLLSDTTALRNAGPAFARLAATGKNFDPTTLFEMAVHLGINDQLALTTALAGILEKHPRRQQIVDGIGRLGENASPAIPVLLKMYDKEPGLEAPIAIALGRTGTACVAPIKLRLMSTDSKQRHFAIRVFNELGERGGVEAAKALVEYLTTMPEQGGLEARAALARMKKIGVEAVLPFAEDQNTTLRNSIFWVIEHAGPDGAEAVPVLLRQIEDSQARHTLKALGACTLPGVLGVLKSGTDRERVSAILTLQAMGPIAREAVPNLIEALGGALELRVAAAQALGAMGSDAATAVPSLARALNDAETKVVDAAALALERIGEPAAIALAHVIAENNANARIAALGAFRGLGSQGASAIPQLLEALKDGEPAIAPLAAEALGCLGKSAASAVPILAEVAAIAPTPAIRDAAAQALVRIGTVRLTDLNAMLKWLDTGPPRLKAVLSQIVANLGGEAEIAALSLLRLVDDESFEVRAVARQSILRLRRVRAKDGPEIVKALSHRNWSVRESAVALLKTLNSTDILQNKDVDRALNEVAAYRASLEIFSAQRKFKQRDPNADNIHEYASNLRGDHSLLESKGGQEDLRLIHREIALADDRISTPTPYRGYRFRILTAAGKGAVGGSRSYFRDGYLTEGIAIIAYPVDANSGRVAYLTSEDGKVFMQECALLNEKVLRTLEVFDPTGWRIIESR